jgi:hypothetical protein
MEKLVIGCVVLLVLLGIGGIAGSWFVYHKVSSTMNGFAELRRVPDIERSVRTRAAYVPPASGEPSEAQLQRLLKVQARSRSASVPTRRASNTITTTTCGTTTARRPPICPRSQVRMATSPRGT